jgi:hypothetical protein
MRPTAATPAARPSRCKRTKKQRQAGGSGPHRARLPCARMLGVFPRESPSPAGLPESDSATWMMALLPVFQFSDNCSCESHTLWLGWRESQAAELASPGDAVLMPTKFESPAAVGTWPREIARSPIGSGGAEAVRTRPTDNLESWHANGHQQIHSREGRTEEKRPRPARGVCEDSSCMKGRGSRNASLLLDNSRAYRGQGEPFSAPEG